MATYKIYEIDGKEHTFHSIVDARKKAYAMVKDRIAWVEICNYDMRDWHYPDGYVIGEVFRDRRYSNHVMWRASSSNPVKLMPSGKI